MSLENAVKNYARVRADYEADQAAHERLRDEQIPSAEQAVEAAKQKLQMAEMMRRRADTMEKVQAAKNEVRQAEELVQDAELLLSNLNGKLGDWPRAKIHREAELRGVEREMWTLKKAELLERLALPPAAIKELECIIAADFGITGGFRKYSIGHAVEFKHGNMDFERIQEVNRQLLDGMLADLS